VLVRHGVQVRRTSEDAVTAPDILTSPVRVDARGGHVYFFDGYLSVDIVSGTEEQQKAVLALVGQAQRAFLILRAEASGHGWYVPCGCETCAVLRDARVMA
jgi:hypothetical protein